MSTQYDILKADSAPHLIRLVNERLASGWACQGGVMADVQRVPVTFYQAIVKAVAP